MIKVIGRLGGLPPVEMTMRQPRRNHSPQFKAKVALEALRGERALANLTLILRILDYVVEATIDCIADWVCMADWVHMEMSPEFSRRFEIVVRDEALNLGVLRRIGPVTKLSHSRDEG